jgi:dTDP-4-amino-4,6-dideoxygalactose transaminase
MDAVQRVIASGWVAQGPEVVTFEQAFAAYVDAPYACAVSSGTTALHLALLAVGVAPGDEVITVSHSFIATANAIRYCGATPVFVDIDPVTYNLDPARITAAISPRTAALLIVHQMGMPADMARILPLAAKYRLPVVEDAACAIGSEIYWQGQWQRIGRPHGQVACFSFHPRKLLTTGDGGMLVTSSPEIDRHVRQWRQHGLAVPAPISPDAPDIPGEAYPVLGFNYRLTDLQAAIGTVQLQRLPELLQERRALAALYTSALQGIPGLRPPSEPTYVRSNWQSYMVRLEDASRQLPVMQALHHQGISTRRGIMCAHLEAPYAATWPAGCLPHSEAARQHGVILPLYPGMRTTDIERVVTALRAALA